MRWMLTTPTLVGDHVLLRPLVIGDADALAAAGSVDRSTYGLTPVPDTVAAATTYIQAALDGLAKGWRLPFATLYQGQVVGSS